MEWKDQAGKFLVGKSGDSGITDVLFDNSELLGVYNNKMANLWRLGDDTQDGCL